MADIEICGVLVHARPEKVHAVGDILADMPGVEVHAITDDGRLVVTIEELPGQKIITKTMEAFNGVAGVLSTSLIYQHSEPAESEAA